MVSESKKLISSGSISKLSRGQKEFSSSHSLLFPPFLPLCWKASWIFCKLRKNVLGLKTSSQRHRLPAGVSQRSHSLSVGLLKTFSLLQYATTQNCAHRWPILQWEQGGTSHWHFWEVSTGPSSCFPNGLLGMMLEEEFLSVPGVFCSAPLSRVPKAYRESTVLLWIPGPIYGWAEFCSHCQENFRK